MANVCGNFINGKIVTGRASETTPVFNPSRGEVIATTPIGTAEDADYAVRAARDAFSAWADTPPGERTHILFRYRQILEDNFEPLSRLVTREHGKTPAEARGRVEAVVVDDGAGGFDAQVVDEAGRALLRLHGYRTATLPAPLDPGFLERLSTL